MRACLSVSLFDGWLISHELGFSFYGSLRIQQSSLRSGRCPQEAHKRASTTSKIGICGLKSKTRFWLTDQKNQEAVLK
tara:strand:- start:463 stop:696 length:234 start_codon:yes stop_codon:yes gene_type:complete